jgi:hypothetical protein
VAGEGGDDGGGVHRRLGVRVGAAVAVEVAEILPDCALV